MRFRADNLADNLDNNLDNNLVIVSVIIVIIILDNNHSIHTAIAGERVNANIPLTNPLLIRLLSA